MAVGLRYTLAVTCREDEGHVVGGQPVGNRETGFVTEIDIEKCQIEGLAGEEFHRIGNAWRCCDFRAQAAQNVFAIHGDDEVILDQQHIETSERFLV